MTISFKQYLSEVSQTKRVGIEHLTKMRPLVFLELVDFMEKQLGGVLDASSVRIAEKVDGSSFRFGLDKNNKFFIESSYSGPIFDRGGYSNMVIKKYGKATDVSKAFDEVLDKLKSKKDILNILKKYQTESGIKIVGELFYNPLGDVQGKTIKFIKISYDRKKLADEITYVPIKVLDGVNNTHPQESKIIKELIAISDTKIKFMSNQIKNVKIDLRAEIEDVRKFIKSHKNYEEILKSRKKVHRELKYMMAAMIGEFQSKMSKKVLSVIKRGLLGPDFEGVVVDLSKEKSFKVVTDKFKSGVFDKKMEPKKPIKEKITFKNFCLKLEGGNAIKQSTRINQENVQGTLTDIYKKLLPKLKIKISDTRLLGSTGKKGPGGTSGDIDLGVSSQALIKKNKLQTLDDIYDHLVKVSKSFGLPYKDLRSIGLVSIGWPIANVDGKQENDMVQLDLMVTDSLDYSAWAYHSPSYIESDLKGLYRNEILFAIAKFMDVKVLKSMDGLPVEWERNFFDLQGFFRGVKSKQGKKKVLKNPKTIDKWLVTKEPDEVVKIMFGPRYKAKNILLFDDALKAVLNNNFIHKKYRQDILDATAKGILDKGYPIPDSLAKVAKV